MTDERALDDWEYTDRTLRYLSGYDLDAKNGRLIEVLSPKSGRKTSLVIPFEKLEMFQDFEELEQFDGYIRKLGPWECYLNRLVGGWQWEIISFDESFQPIWDLSEEVYDWQSQAAEGLFSKYPHLYEYTKERR